MEHKHWKSWLAALACGGALGACFEGEFAQGLPCTDDEGCGPSLRCIEGLCGGLGERSVCGNGLLEAEEECDLGSANDDVLSDCTTQCQIRLPVCGDGRVEGDEECDDGNDYDGDFCSNACLLPVCGDGIVGPGEGCDDGNLSDADTCTSMCSLPECGDGLVSPGEGCDDGNADNSDACTTSCQAPTCDDGEHDGGETDIDCGGGECAPCALGGACESAQDCASGECVDGTCAAVQLAAGGGRVCATLVGPGSVRCWGRNTDGNLGYGHTMDIGDDESPVSAGDVSLGGAAVQAACGADHSCAALEDGGLRCWGRDDFGQLGIGEFVGSIGDDELPSRGGVVTVGGPVVQVAAGWGHSCALLEDGSVRCWGANHIGQLGLGHQAPYVVTPTDAVEVGGSVTQVDAGGYHTCALLEGGSVRCWGNNFLTGALGYPDIEFEVGDDETPASVGDVEVGGVVTQLALGGNISCALLEGGSVRCWGEGEGGKGIGYPSIYEVGAYVTPASAGDIELGGPATQIAVGDKHICAVLEVGSLRCWGANDFGQLGYGHTMAIGDDETPASAGDVDLGGLVVTQVAAGDRSVCVVAGGLDVLCWGADDYGQLGNPNISENIGDDETPASLEFIDWL